MKALKQNLKIPFFLELKTFLLSGPSPGLKDCEGYSEHVFLDGTCQTTVFSQFHFLFWLFKYVLQKNNFIAANVKKCLGAHS